MCGIAGIITGDRKFPLFQSIRTMTDVLRHRGPDDEGYLLADVRNRSTLIGGGKDTPKAVYRSPLPYAPKREMDALALDRDSYHLAFGHRRLSIIDLSPAGHQPMCNKNGTLWIVYNGEIYNYLELRAELKSFGYTFQSNADTEVLLTAYEHWGVGALNRFVGMFAFAILNLEQRRIFLARDFFGIKPLYYTIWRGGFAFASEIKALLQLPWLHREVNAQRLYEYLRSGVTDHGGETLFSSIHQVPSAHYLEISLDRPDAIQLTRYWDLKVDQRSNMSFDAAARRLRSIFLENVRLHLRSDVSIGTALSGGIDSSSIAMMVSRLQSPKQAFHTFSFIPDDEALSEEKWIDLIGQAAGALVHKTRVNPHDILREIDSLIEVQDEPFLSMSICAQHQVFSSAHWNGIKVMLDGQGADEILGGYHTHLESRLASLIRRGRCLSAINLLTGISSQGNFHLRDLIFSTAGFFLPFQLQALPRKLLGKDLCPLWLDATWFLDRGVAFQIPEKPAGRELFKKHLYQTLSHTVLPMLLRYEDRNSMCHSVESRVPFLTPTFIEFIFGLPDEYILSKEGESKSVFRKAMRGIVPDQVLDRKDKVGFLTPEKQWLISVQRWCEKLLQSETTHHIGALNQEVIRREFQLFLNHSKDSNLPIWRLVNLIRWATRFDVAFV